MKNKKINLGNGCYYENGELHEALDENIQSPKEWMTWDEGWQWVINSLSKIEELENESDLQP